jgi:hypothetical protein
MTLWLLVVAACHVVVLGRMTYVVQLHLPFLPSLRRLYRLD